MNHTDMKKKIVSIVGARPQFIKAAPLSRVVRLSLHEVLVHTGQHYDENMSKVFFDGLGMPRPDYNLEAGSGSHAVQTGLMLERIENVLLNEKPGMVLVYGDTNSTLAGSLAAAKLCIPVAHVEAGLRSYNRSMPEEINRIIADRCSDLLFCPTPAAVSNLKKEGMEQGVHLTGDVMFDAALLYGRAAEEKSTILSTLGLKPGHYLLCTVHRAENTDDVPRLASIIGALIETGEAVVFPVHPRTRTVLASAGLSEKLEKAKRILLIDPVNYLDMVALEKQARLVLTDSGGVQKEAYFYEVPCITLRDETEWTETVEDGWNAVVGTDVPRIVDAVRTFAPESRTKRRFGDGHAAERMAEWIVKKM
jgi:UDP-N-acetylglucosamine 2-epimerase (non-hydrolysing)